MALNDIDTSLITVGQPTEGGCAFACIGEPTALPTDATTKMGTLADFESCGTISENGFTLSKSVTTNKFKDWGGKVVLTAFSDEENTFKIEFTEINRPVVQERRCGHGRKRLAHQGRRRLRR